MLMLVSSPGEKKVKAETPVTLIKAVSFINHTAFD